MIHVGIAGLGFMGMIHYLAYQKLSGVRVSAICDQDPERLSGDWRRIKGNFGPQGTLMDLEGIARYERLEEMMADGQLDMIDVCLPPAAHAKTTLAALAAGKHVFCEKPIALVPRDAEEMVLAARRARRLLMIGHVLPFFPEYRFAYRTVSSGKYGRMLGGHFKRMISNPAWVPDFYNPAVVGGPMLDLHVHDAHFIRLLCGMPRAVNTIGRMRGSVAELFQTQFHFPRGGPVVSAWGGCINQPGRPFTHAYEIYLEKATLLFDFAAIGRDGVLAMPLTVLTNAGRITRPKLSSGDPVDAFVAELHEVVRSVRQGLASPLLDGKLARDALTLCHRQTQSLMRGKPVAV